MKFLNILFFSRLYINQLLNYIFYNFYLPTWWYNCYFKASCISLGTYINSVGIYEITLIQFVAKNDDEDQCNCRNSQPSQHLKIPKTCPWVLQLWNYVSKEKWPHFQFVGEPQSFEVKFKRVEDYPIDLYYLMDLSFSMEDDLPSVKKLGADLMEEMRNITADFRMGLSTSITSHLKCRLT